MEPPDAVLRGRNSLSLYTWYIFFDGLKPPHLTRCSFGVLSPYTSAQKQKGGRRFPFIVSSSCIFLSYLSTKSHSLASSVTTFSIVIFYLSFAFVFSCFVRGRSAAAFAASPSSSASAPAAAAAVCMYAWFAKVLTQLAEAKPKFLAKTGKVWYDRRAARPLVLADA